MIATTQKETRGCVLALRREWWTVRQMATRLSERTLGAPKNDAAFAAYILYVQRPSVMMTFQIYTLWVRLFACGFSEPAAERHDGGPD